MTERARMAVVVRDGLDDSTLQALGDACARLGAGVQVWNGPKSNQRIAPPALVVAGLAPGARELSDEVLELADRRFPGTEVLLVCNEPLVRPMLSLQRGRLTLIEPPATVERMASRIRLLLTHEPDVDGVPGGIVGLAQPQSGSFTGQEFRRPAWWAAGLSCAGPGGEAPPPRAWLGLDGGLTAVLTAPAEQVREDVIDRAIELLRHEHGNENRDQLLEQTLGQRAGLVHLTADHLSWLIYWPCSWQPLWLFSTQRLPRWSNLTKSSAVSLWRVPAVAGDVIAGLSSAELFVEGSALPSTETSAAMLDGAPALLTLFEERLAAAPRPFSCVLAEVR